jgi:hypothetical protein
VRKTGEISFSKSTSTASWSTQLVWKRTYATGLGKIMMSWRNERNDIRKMGRIYEAEQGVKES